MELSDLMGEHELSGVDMTNEEVKEYEWADPEMVEICRFVLDGKTYTAIEDPSDGYRSHMRELQEGGVVRNRFAPQRVVCRHRRTYEYGGESDVLVMTDVVTGKDVLTIGTENTDDYYPYFVADFSPENMACNQEATP